MKSSTHKWIAAGILAAAGFFVFVCIIVVFAGSDGSVSDSSLRFGKRIAVVRLEGEIYDANWHTELLRTYRTSSNVAGVLLRVDSPGGAVAPSQEIYREVAAYKAAGKPIVVSMGNVAASGGYYISAPAQKIFASPGTLTGSIGVIFSLPMYQELAKKVGIDFRMMKAGELKDAGSPFRPMTDKETKYFQEILDDVHEQFIIDVAAGRNAPAEKFRAIADGRVLTGKQAVECGLIDTLGGYAEALSYLNRLCNISESTKPVEKRPSSSWRELLMESAQKRIPGLETLSRRAGLYYLFTP